MLGTDAIIGILSGAVVLLLIIVLVLWWKVSDLEQR